MVGARVVIGAALAAVSICVGCGSVDTPKAASPEAVASVDPQQESAPLAAAEEATTTSEGDETASEPDKWTTLTVPSPEVSFYVPVAWLDTAKWDAEHVIELTPPDGLTTIRAGAQKDSAQIQVVFGLLESKAKKATGAEPEVLEINGLLARRASSVEDGNRMEMVLYELSWDEVIFIMVISKPGSSDDIAPVVERIMMSVKAVR